MRLIVNCVIYNESEFIGFFLDNIRRIRDVFAVELLDGSWSQEQNPTINSIDNTKQLINEWKSKNAVPFDVNYTTAEHIWESEGDKRNALLQMTEEKYGKCWVLILDADEFIKYPSGVVSMDIVPELEQHDTCGIMKGYAYQSALATIFPVRFIPTQKGIHYHTDYPMIIHDDMCKIVCDYNPGREKKSDDCWYISQMFLVNNWTLRNNERQCSKYYYQKFIENQDKEVKCRWKK